MLDYDHHKGFLRPWKKMKNASLNNKISHNWDNRCPNIAE